MKVPEKLLAEFRRQGARGGRERARRLSPAERSAAARLAVLRRWVARRFGHGSFAELGLPGGDVVDRGLADLAAGRETRDSLLVALAAPRLRRENVPLPRTTVADADARLYRRLEQTEGDLAHARYLACLRQMSSFADACAAIQARHRHAS